VSEDPVLVARLMPEGYGARAEQAILFDVAAWDSNCPQHIPRKVDFARIAALESENARLRARLEELDR